MQDYLNNCVFKKNLFTVYLIFCGWLLIDFLNTYNIKERLCSFFSIEIPVHDWDVVMIDSIRSDDGFGLSKRVDRTGPPADGEATNIVLLIQTFEYTRSD